MTDLGNFHNRTVDGEIFGRGILYTLGSIFVTHFLIRHVSVRISRNENLS